MLNNNFKDIPLGFGMALAKNEKAFENYGKLPQEQKDEIISYIKSASTGEQAKQRIYETVNKLNQQGNSGNVIG